MLTTLIIEPPTTPATLPVPHPSYTLGRITDPLKCHAHFQAICELEDVTFRLLCELHGANFGDIDPNYDVEDENLLRIPTTPLSERWNTNPLLNKWYPGVASLEEMKKASYPFYRTLNIQALADIYGQDLYTLRQPGERAPICVLQNGVYLGHIYRLVISPGDKSMCLIGIRESLHNAWLKSEQHPSAVYGIAKHLLDAAVTHARDLNRFQSVHLEQPIGGMRERALKLGWYLGEYYYL